MEMRITPTTGDCLNGGSYLYSPLHPFNDPPVYPWQYYPYGDHIGSHAVGRG